jgi:hypothetical protein
MIIPRNLDEAKEELIDIESELEGLKARRDFAANLGSNFSQGGRSNSFSDLVYFDKKIDVIKLRRRTLKDWVKYYQGTGPRPTLATGVNRLMEAHG